MINVICCIAKCENNYINDWVNWHINLGFDHIHIYDNNDPDYEPVESRIEKLDRVTIYKVPNNDKPDGIHPKQLWWYSEFYKEHNKEFDWCAFIDCNEFIELTKWNNIKDFLSDPIFKNQKVIRLNMRMYTDDNKITRDMSVPVYKSFKHWLKNNSKSTGGKSIVRGNINGLFMSSAHFPRIDDKYEIDQINPDGIIGRWRQNCLPDSEAAHINHYKTKTLSEFIDQKLERGDACLINRKIDFKYYWDINEKTKEKIDYLKSRGFKDV